MCGVLIVLISVGASIGIFGLIGIESTLIIFEIIPFLVLWPLEWTTFSSWFKPIKEKSESLMKPFQVNVKGIKLYY